MPKELKKMRQKDVEKNEEIVSVSFIKICNILCKCFSSWFLSEPTPCH